MAGRGAGEYSCDASKCRKTHHSGLVRAIQRIRDHCGGAVRLQHRDTCDLCRKITKGCSGRLSSSLNATKGAFQKFGRIQRVVFGSGARG